MAVIQIYSISKVPRAGVQVTQCTLGRRTSPQLEALESNRRLHMCRLWKAVNLSKLQFPENGGKISMHITGLLWELNKSTHVEHFFTVPAQRKHSVNISFVIIIGAITGCAYFSEASLTTYPKYIYYFNQYLLWIHMQTQVQICSAAISWSSPFRRFHRNIPAFTEWYFTSPNHLSLLFCNWCQFHLPKRCF